MWLSTHYAILPKLIQDNIECKHVLKDNNLKWYAFYFLLILAICKSSPPGGLAFRIMINLSLVRSCPYHKTATAFKHELCALKEESVITKFKYAR